MDRSRIGTYIFGTMMGIMLVIIVFDKSVDLIGKVSVIVISLIFVAIGRGMNQTKRGQKRNVNSTWQTLAKQTGLTFEDGPLATLGAGFSPSLRGVYRDYYMTMTLFVEDSGGEYAVARVFTRTSLMAVGDGSINLEVRGRSTFDKIFRRDAILSGDEEFDHACFVKGSPPEFTRRAIRVILSYKTILLTRTEDLILLVFYPLSWTSWIRPSIKLENSELVCLQHGVHTRTSAQKQFLDLLCDLADVAEGS